MDPLVCSLRVPAVTSNITGSCPWGSHAQNPNPKVGSSQGLWTRHMPHVSPILLDRGCLHMASTSPRRGPFLRPFWYFVPLPVFSQNLGSHPQLEQTSHLPQDQDPSLHSVKCIKTGRLLPTMVG